MSFANKGNYFNLKDGETVYHTDGTSSRRSGDIIYHSDGSTSRIAGDNIYHDDGSSSYRSGDTVHHSDGSCSYSNGSSTFNTSDGSSSYNNSNSNDGSCYLTTACITAKNLPDNCEELTLLRNFRDSFLKDQPSGKTDIQHYYMVAPQIVAHIRSLPNGKEIFTNLYEQLVVPCVNYIKQGKFMEAYTLYKKISLQLEEKYCNK